MGAAECHAGARAPRIGGGRFPKRRVAGPYRGIETEKGHIAPYGRVISNLPAVLAAIEGASVKALISGHLHTVEEIDYNGRRFISSGSVSGQQWNGPRLGFPEGFGIFDCRPDGTFDYTYQSYGWKAAKAS